MIGKWHLGNDRRVHAAASHGFTEFFGVPHSNDEKNFFVCDGRRSASRDGGPVAADPSLHRPRPRVPRRAAHDEQPFFLYIAHNAPHVPLYPSADFAGRSRRGTYGDVVEELDASVGEVMAQGSRSSGSTANTLVIFTSDNGPWLAMRDWGGSAGGLRGGKTSTFEGGHRVPALARWPGRIPGGPQRDDVADMMDWLPTLAELAGAPIPGRPRRSTAESLVGVLEGTRRARADALLLLPPPRFPSAINTPEVGAVRDGRWKLKLPQCGYPELFEPLAKTELYAHDLLLFDLEADPGERHDVAAEHPDVVERVSRRRSSASRRRSTPARPVLDDRGAVRSHRLGEDVARRGAGDGRGASARRCCFSSRSTASREGSCDACRRRQTRS